MNKVNRLQDYNPPKAEIIVVEVEQGFNASGDPTITNPEMGWDD